MQNTEFTPLLKEFAQKPSGTTAFALIKSCKQFICSQAFGWREPNMSFADKIKEIMAEMLLILLEDFDFTRLRHENSVYKYLCLRLRRLTRPKKSKLIFTDLGESSEYGRYNFSASKLRFAEEIVCALRSFLFAGKDKNVVDLEFLFIHICPETRWISKLLAQANGLDEQKQAINDRKRHSRFKLSLKNSLKNLQYGDISEISSWSGGERSHLAWQIINIAPCEIYLEAENDRQKLDLWRESINPLKQQPIDGLKAARHVYESMKRVQRYAQDKPSELLAAEEFACYGACTESGNDILSLLLGTRAEVNTAEETPLLTAEGAYEANDAEQKIFDEAANEICQWFSSLTEHVKHRTQPRLSYL